MISVLRRLLSICAPSPRPEALREGVSMLRGGFLFGSLSLEALQTQALGLRAPLETF